MCRCLLQSPITKSLCVLGMSLYCCSQKCADQPHLLCTHTLLLQWRRGWKHWAQIQKKNLLSLCENLFGCHLVKAGVSFKNSPNPFKSLASYKVINPRTACFFPPSSLLTYFTSKTHFGCVLQVPRGFLETARCQGWTTTSSALETSGSWRRADFYWRVEPMMVGTGTLLGIWDNGMRFCTPFTVTAPYNGWTVGWIFTVIMTCSLGEMWHMGQNVLISETWLKTCWKWQSD